MRYVGVPLLTYSGAADFSLDLPRRLPAIEREQPALVFLAYPNNPTGNLFSALDVKQIIEASPGLVVLDEAYYAFASDSFIPHLAATQSAVMRTFSKLGMADCAWVFWPAARLGWSSWKSCACRIMSHADAVGRRRSCWITTRCCCSRRNKSGMTAPGCINS